MNVLCPNCGTEFNIPAHLYKVGGKARCAVCSCIFLLPDIPDSETVNVQQQVAQQPSTQNQSDTASQATTVNPSADPSVQPSVQSMSPQGSPAAQAEKPLSPAAPDKPAEADPALDGVPAKNLATDFDDFDDFIKSVDQSGAASGTQADASSASAAKAAQVSPPKVPAASSSTAPQAPEEFNEEDLGGQAVLADEIDEVLKNSTKRTEVAEEEPSPKKKSRKKLILLVALLLLLVGAGFGAYLLFFSTPKDQTENQLPVKTAEVSPETLAKVKKMDIRTSGIKYDYVRNKKLGPILVLEGRVTNYFDTPKDYITVEVKLFNSKGAVVKTQKQVCGVVLTALQLSELGQIELTRALSDRIAIMANNVNVIPGTSVPFMLVVIYPPTDVVELEVSVVDVTDPPAAGSRGDN